MSLGPPAFFLLRYPVDPVKLLIFGMLVAPFLPVALVALLNFALRGLGRGASERAHRNRPDPALLGFVGQTRGIQPPDFRRTTECHN